MLLFLYGTLKKGFGLNDLLGDEAKLLDTGYIDGACLFDLGGAPALLCLKDGYNAGEWRVHGEIWDVPNEVVFNSLDRVEGHPNLYERKAIFYYGHDPVEAYTMNDLSLVKDKLIPSGKWERIGG